MVMLNACMTFLLGFVYFPSASSLPTFGGDSATIDNQYLRFDQFPASQNFTGWGSAQGDVMVYSDQGTEVVNVQDVNGGVYVNVNSRKLNMITGPNPDDIYTMYLAQDVLDDVYAVKFIGVIDGEQQTIVFPKPIINPTYPYLPKFMPATVVVDQVLDEPYQGYIRKVKAMACCPISLDVTHWGEVNYSGNVQIETTNTNVVPNDVGYEYYHPSTNSDSGGLLRTTNQSGTSGYDRGDPPPTPTATVTRTPTATPSPTPAWTDTGWSTASSDTPLSGLLFYGDKVAHGMAGRPAENSVATHHILAHFASDNRWYTGIAVANPNPITQANISLTAYGNTGGSLGTTSFQVPPFGKVSKLMNHSSMFGTNLGTGWVDLTSTVNVVAFDLYGDKISGGIAALSSSQLGSTLVFPHFISSNRWWTGITVLNPSLSTNVFVKMTGYSSTGQVLGTRNWAILYARQKLVGYAETLLGIPSGQSGWILVEATGGTVGGVLVFGDKQAVPNEIAAMPAVPTSSTLNLSFARSDDEWWTGVAMVNPSATLTAQVALKAYASDGTLIDDASLTVAPLQKTMSLVNALFTLGTTTEGWVEATSDIPIVGLQLTNCDDASEQAWGLAGVEYQPTGSQLYLPHYDVTTRWWTLFSLANPHDSLTATLNLFAYGDGGSFGGVQSHTIAPNGNLADGVKSLMGRP